MKTTHAPVSLPVSRKTRKTRKTRKSTLRRSILGAGIAALLGIGSAPLHAGPPALPATYWLGQTDSNWSGLNWASDAAGTATTATPTSADAIIFSATGAANRLTVLDADFTIQSLTIQDLYPSPASSGVSIGNAGTANTLTISGGSGTGITVASGSLFYLSSKLNFGGSSDTITVNGSGVASIYNAVGGNGIIKAGTGSLALLGTNTYTGGTTISAGDLQVNSDSSLGTGGITFNGANGGTLSVFASGFSSSKSISITEGALGRIGNFAATPAFFSGGITLGSGSTLAFGAFGLTGVIVLSGEGTPNSAAFVTVDYGTVRNGDANGIGQYTAVAQTTTIAAGATLDMNGFDVAIKNLEGAGTITDSNPQDPVLTLTSGTFSGVIQDGGGQVVVVKNGAASDVLTLTGANTYTGGTEISGGSLSFASGSLGSTGSIEFTGTSTLRWETGNTQDVSGRILLDDVDVTFNTNGNNVTFANSLGIGGEADGSALVTKTGAGTLTLAATNTYTGGTNINAGTLSFISGGLGTEGEIAFTGNSSLRWEMGNTQDISPRLRIDDGVNATFDTNGNNITLANAFKLEEDGSAAVTKAGAGTLTILGSNTYTGGTTISAGTLFLGDGSTLGASLGTGGVVVNTNAYFQLDLANGEVFANTIANSGHVIADDNPNNNYTMSGVISGTGDFTKTGTNTVTLSALNTYTGETKVQMGTLMAGISTPGGPGATGPGAFGNGSEVYVSNGGILQLNGHHVGIGSLQSGEGQSQTPAIVQNSSLTPATLTIGGGSYGYFGGIIQDGPLGQIQTITIESQPSPKAAPLSLWKTGGNIQILAGLNTYTGTTTVNGGILRAGISNPSGGPGAFGNNSAVTVNGTGILQLAGNTVSIGSLSGDAGGIVENAAGFLTQGKSKNPFEGQDATLITGSDNTSTTYAGLIRDGEGNFRRAFVRTFDVIDTPIVGTLAFTKTGSGTQTLTGSNTYTGGTTILAGTLAAGNTKAFGNGNFTMSGGTLKTSGGTRIVDIGAGKILFTGGTYVAQVGGTMPGTQHDQLKTTGSANISGGFLSLVQQNGFLLKSGSKVVLLSAAGGVAGGSAGGTAVSGSKVGGLSAFSNTSLLVPTVNLYTDSVVLEAMQGSFIISGLTPNQIAVAIALNSLSGITGGHTGVISELDFLNNQPIDKIPELLDMMAPEELTAIFNLAKSLADIQSKNIQRRLEEIRAELGAGSPGPVGTPGGGASGPVGKRGKEIAPASSGRLGLWFTGSGEFTRVGSTYNAAGFDLETGGVTVGMDYRFTDHFAAGISLGYMNTHGSLENGGSMNVDGGRIGAYGTYFQGGTHVDLAVNGGFNSYRIRRVTPNNTSASGSTDGSEFNILLAAGHDWKRGALTFGPTASLQYTNMQLDGYSETGAFAPLNIQTKAADSLRTSLGFRASYETKVAGKTVKPEVRAAWQHEFGDTTYTINSNFATLGGSAFTVAGPSTGRDSLLVGAGVTVQWNDRLAVYLNYDGEVGRKNYESHSVSGGFRIQF